MKKISFFFGFLFVFFSINSQVQFANTKAEIDSVLARENLEYTNKGIQCIQKTSRDQNIFLTLIRSTQSYEVYTKKAGESFYDQLFHFKSPFPLDSIVPVYVKTNLLFLLFHNGKSCIINEEFSGKIRSNLFYDRCELFSYRGQTICSYLKNSNYKLSYFDFDDCNPDKYPLLTGLDSFVVADKWHGIIDYYKDGKFYTHYSTTRIPQTDGFLCPYNENTLQLYGDSLRTKNSQEYIINCEQILSEYHKQGYWVVSDQNLLKGIKYEVFSEVGDTVMFIYKIRKNKTFRENTIIRLLSEETFSENQGKTTIKITIFQGKKTLKQINYNKILPNTPPEERAKNVLLEMCDIWNYL